MRFFFSLISLLFLFSCSTEEDSFKFDAAVNTPNVIVDKPFSITVTSDQNIMGISYSFDNFETSFGEFPSAGFGTSKELHFKFLTIGEKTIYIKLTKAGDIESETKAITVDVGKGDRVRITGLKITSFDGINTVWDPEYNASNPNSFADVRFCFNKVGLLNAFDGGGYSQQFYLTSIKENQGDLTWSFLTEDLYIDPEGYIIFSIYDQDESNLIQLLNNSVNVPHIYMHQYASTKPNSITVSFPESNSVEFTLNLEWPN
ncbi:hypothetical protein [Flavobacterium sp. GT3R68]|uniref:hypothetical protein n=1 Tax=Flavobacterium sp. GT3R68 TaxID=2594437 RepID=UPI000F85C2D8|nr:hypothetical protein [Flavobacterium sp. GT3R68]RTY85667.1 hypothetical protein EKL32_28410 [Flavobacterium sp. GSN2]TRW90049.1 hypothetical protein FNW07_11350 [Flavobacterium sp. GT3R68]